MISGCQTYGPVHAVAYASSELARSVGPNLSPAPEARHEKAHDLRYRELVIFAAAQVAKSFEGREPGP